MLVMLGTLALQLLWHSDTWRLYDRYYLPGFDARVYMAMAEAPGMFTLPPWGYRLLVPGLVHLLPGQPRPEAFMALSLTALALAGGLLFVYLRRLGHASRAALLGVAVFGLSLPVGQTVRVPFLAEPVLIALLLGFLVAAQARGGGAALALLAVLGSWGKEAFLLFVPHVFWVRRRRDGWRRALGAASGALAPAVLAHVLLRRVWTPELRSEAAWPGLDVLGLALYRILEGAPDWWFAALLFGVTPLAVAGAVRPAARPFLTDHAWLLAVTLSLPFAASVYTDDTGSVPFFAGDIPRLLLYALPPLLHLALLAGQPLWKAWQPAAPAGRVPARLERGAAVAALLAMALPAVAVDRYRRVDLRGPRDGPLVLALCRQSLAFARRLEKGRPVTYDPPGRRFLPERSDLRHLERMRWFLLDGWGPKPHYGAGRVVMALPEAGVLLPCLEPARWRLSLRMRSTHPLPVRADVNGRPVGTFQTDPRGERVVLEVPAEALFRGDNRLGLQAAPGVELLALRIQPVS